MRKVSASSKFNGEYVNAGLFNKQFIKKSDGRPSQRCILTAKGEWLYQKLNGVAPQVGDHVGMLKTHKSEWHLAVIMKPA